MLTREVLSMAISVATLAATTAGQPQPSSRIVEQADRYVNAYAERGEFMGSVLIAQHGQPVFRKAYGFADVSWHVPNTVDSRFNIGSLTKQFTGVAVLQLLAAGKLGLDDPVSKYYASAPESWRSVTIAHLLEHRSGIAGPSGPGDYPKGINTTYIASELVEIVAKKPLEFSPGSRFKYSNAGYYVLGYLIEIVSGQTYIEYLRSHVFQPLKMNNSGFDSVRELIPKRAIGYAGEPNRLRYADHVDWSLAFAAGGLYSTVDDLLLWDRGLASNRLLEPASTTRLQTPTDHGYNFGWFVNRHEGTVRMYHEGSNPGYAGFIYRFPAEELLIVVLSNFESAPVRKIADGLLAVANGKHP